MTRRALNPSRHGRRRRLTPTHRLCDVARGVVGRSSIESTGIREIKIRSTWHLCSALIIAPNSRHAVAFSSHCPRGRYVSAGVPVLRVPSPELGHVRVLPAQSDPPPHGGHRGYIPPSLGAHPGQPATRGSRRRRDGEPRGLSERRLTRPTAPPRPASSPAPAASARALPGAAGPATPSASCLCARAARPAGAGSRRARRHHRRERRGSAR